MPYPTLMPELLLAGWPPLAQAAAPSPGAPNLLTYFSQSNLAGQAIVVLLALFSLWAWSIMLGKWGDLQELRRRNAVFVARLREHPRLLALAGGPLGENPGTCQSVTQAALDAWAAEDAAAVPLETRVDLMENAIQRALGAATQRYEDRLILLGSMVQGGPFLGLLGTVWGVMDAFGAVALQQSATIQTLAPGVAGALLTTVAGLCVAIPSSFGYNYLLARSRSLAAELENFASGLADRLEIEARANAD